MRSNSFGIHADDTGADSPLNPLNADFLRFRVTRIVVAGGSDNQTAAICFGLRFAFRPDAEVDRRCLRKG